MALTGRPFQRFRITTVVSYDTGCRLPVRFRHQAVLGLASHDFLLLCRLMVHSYTSNNLRLPRCFNGWQNKGWDRMNGSSQRHHRSRKDFF